MNRKKVSDPIAFYTFSSVYAGISRKGLGNFASIQEKARCQVNLSLQHRTMFFIQPQSSIVNHYQDLWKTPAVHYSALEIDRFLFKRSESTLFPVHDKALQPFFINQTFSQPRSHHELMKPVDARKTGNLEASGNPQAEAGVRKQWWRWQPNLWWCLIFLFVHAPGTMASWMTVASLWKPQHLPACPAEVIKKTTPLF